MEIKKLFKKNFWQEVFKKTPKIINKPEEQKRVEQWNPFLNRRGDTEKPTSCPYFESQALAKIRRKRRVKNRIQRASRKANRNQ